jgi:hypothetical protein
MEISLDFNNKEFLATQKKTMAVVQQFVDEAYINYINVCGDEIRTERVTMKNV